MVFGPSWERAHSYTLHDKHIAPQKVFFFCLFFPRYTSSLTILDLSLQPLGTELHVNDWLLTSVGTQNPHSKLAASRLL